MFSLNRGKYFIDCGSKITNTEINMNGNVITNHGTPVNPLDVVNKEYVDNAVANGGGEGEGSPLISITVTLVSTTYIQAIPLLTGNLLVFVKNLVTNGPSATFLLSKSESSFNPSITRLTSSSNSLTQEKLRLKWDPDSFIFLRKTGNSSDGQYLVKYIT